MVNCLKKHGYTDLCVKYIKKRNEWEITRRNSRRIVQKLVLDQKGINWFKSMIAGLKEYEPLETNYGLIEAGLSEYSFDNEPWIEITNKELKQKVLIGLNEVEWIITEIMFMRAEN